MTSAERCYGLSCGVAPAGWESITLDKFYIFGYFDNNLLEILNQLLFGFMALRQINSVLSFYFVKVLLHLAAHGCARPMA